MNNVWLEIHVFQTEHDLNQICLYTERQKKLITSSGRRSLKSTASKLIIFGHKEALILLNKNIRKKQDILASKRRKYGLITKGNFSKIAETAHRASSVRAPRKRPIHKIQKLFIQFQWRVT